MGAYIPMIIWLISMVICHYIAKKRNVRPNLFWTLLVVFLGTFAIPLAFLARPAKKCGSTGS